MNNLIKKLTEEEKKYIISDLKNTINLIEGGEDCDSKMISIIEFIIEFYVSEKRFHELF